MSLLAGTVFILNLGISKDLIGTVLSSSFRDIARANMSSLVFALQRILYLPSGNVLFGNNQTTLDLRNMEINFALSSQLIASLDDVAYNSNQSECTSLIDFVFTNTAIWAVTIRTNDNRFQEGVTQALYSLFSYGLMNTAATNQATHCLHVLGHPSFTVVNKDNIVLFSADCTRNYELLKEKFTVQLNS